MKKVRRLDSRQEYDAYFKAESRDVTFFGARKVIDAELKNKQQ